MKEAHDKYQIQSVSRALKIFDMIIAANDEIALSAICDELKINANMAYRLLMTMLDGGYLYKNENTGKFQITLKTLQLSRIAINSLEIRRWSMPFLEELWRKYSVANVNLAILEKGKVLAVARIGSNKVPITHHYIGRILPAHATAVGKILLSEMNEEEIKGIIDAQGLNKYTGKTISTFPMLLEELEKVRKNQLAWDLEEHIPGDNCVATAIRDANGKIIGAISLSVFEIYMNVEELKEASFSLRETANRIFKSMNDIN